MSKIEELGKEALEKGKEAWGEFSKEGGKLEQIEKAANKGVDELQKAVEKAIKFAEEAAKKIEK